jgi:hypothetical protein
MFYVIGDLIASVFWGVLIALLLTAALYFLPGMIYARYRHTLAGGILLVAGFCFFTFQATLCVGGFKLKGYIPSALQIEQFGGGATTLKELGRELTEQYPALEKHIRKITDNDGTAQKESATVADLAQFVRAGLYRRVNNYIRRRAGWIVGGIFLPGFYFVNNASRQNRRREAIYY